MVSLADDLVAWLLGRVADAGLKQLAKRLRGKDRQGALLAAAEAAVQATAGELRPEGGDRAMQLAMVIDQVFKEPLPHSPTTGDQTLLESIRAGISNQLAPLADPNLTGVGSSSAELLEVPTDELAEKLSSHLVRQILDRGTHGGPLTDLADQLNHDATRLLGQATYLQGQRIEDMVLRLADIVTAQVEAATTMSTAVSATRTLPGDVPSFTGQRAALERVTRIVTASPYGRGASRIVLIDGMAGVGKTTFAVHAARKLALHFPDGQLFLRLHGHTPGRKPVDPADALAELLLTIGVAPSAIPAGTEARERLWRDQMAGRRSLLLLDDGTGSEQITPLLPGSAETLVMVTSRHRLAALPEAQAVSLDILQTAEAGRLFVRLAGRRGVRRDDGAVVQVAELCGRLPLAISLMAGQLKHHPQWSAAHLAAELEKATRRLPLMAAERVSVAAAFDLSYRNISAVQQRLFRRIGLHPGTDIDVYSAAAMNETSVEETRRLLDDMFAYHLIDEPAAGRFRFHDLIREHAHTLAEGDPQSEQEAATDRLLDYYLHVVNRADRHLSRRNPTWTPGRIRTPPAAAPDLSGWDDAVSWMDAERLNLQAVGQFAAHHGRPGHALAISAGMHGYLRLEGHWNQALAMGDLAIRAARNSADRPAEADALTDLGNIQYTTADHKAAAATLALAWALYRALGSRLGQANVLNNLGALHRMTGDYDPALASLRQALRFYRSAGSPLGVASTLGELGIVQYLTDDLAAAGTSLARSQAMHDELGSRLGAANALHYLGAVQIAEEDYTAASASLGRALVIQRDLGNRLGQANAIKELGAVQQVTGNYQAAASSFTDALLLYRDLGIRIGEANALSYLGSVQLAVGDLSAAEATLTQALVINRDRGNRLGEADVLTDLGDLRHATGDLQASMTSHTLALQLYRTLHNRYGEAIAQCRLGHAQISAEDYEAASTNLAEALQLFSELEDRLGQAQVLNHLGELALASSTSAEALRLHERALALAASIPSSQEEAASLEGIGRCLLRDGEIENAAVQLRRALAIYEKIGSIGAQKVRDILRAQGLSPDPR